MPGIFLHLKKIRNTKYPMQRALKLMEAISRDLMSQMLKVLGTRRMMHIPFEEFDRLLAACSQVFTVWDDEYEKFQTLLRDLIKKKRDEHLKMIWRISFAHKKLQVRMEHMRKFRKQHEQLRAVILRVLRPSFKEMADKELLLQQQQQQQGGGDLDSKDSGFEAQLRSSQSGSSSSSHVHHHHFNEVNEIEEVDLAYELVKEVDALDMSKDGSDSWDASIKVRKCILFMFLFLLTLSSPFSSALRRAHRPRRGAHHREAARPAGHGEERQ